jgi:hypothetical protein
MRAGGLIVDPNICDQMSLILAEMPGEWTGIRPQLERYCRQLWAPRAPRDPARRLHRRGGASVVRRDVAVNRMEDLNVKSHAEANNHEIARRGGKAATAVR